MIEVLFIGKRDHSGAQEAAEYCKQVFHETLAMFPAKGQSLPEEIMAWNGDYILSYLAPLVIPSGLLSKARCAAINWHPGPPEYPGVGCTNFAVYDGARNYGITCHHMLSAVDSGPIIEVCRFDVLPSDTVLSLTRKCYAHILASFYRVVEQIANRECLPLSPEKWTRKPYTRKELDELSRITPDMDAAEVQRRIRATTYDKPWAFTEIAGIRFNL